MKMHMDQERPRVVCSQSSPNAFEILKGWFAHVWKDLEGICLPKMIAVYISVLICIGQGTAAHASENRSRACAACRHGRQRLHRKRELIGDSLSSALHLKSWGALESLSGRQNLHVGKWNMIRDD